MAGECLCTHDVRCSFVVVPASQVASNADWAVASGMTGGVTMFAATANKESGCSRTVAAAANFIADEPYVVREFSVAPLSAGFNLSISPWSALSYLIRGPRGPITGVATLTSTANAQFVIEPVTLGTSGRSFWAAADITRGVAAQLLAEAGGDFEPQFHYRVAFPPPLPTAPFVPVLDKTIGVKKTFSAPNLFGFADDVTRGLEMPFKSEATFAQQPVAGVLRATFKCVAKFGRETRVSITNVTDNVAPETGRIADGQYTNDPTPTFNGSAEYDTNVAISANGYLMGVVPVNPNGRWSFTAPFLADGTYNFSFTAFDENGYRSETEVFLLTVDNATPKPPLLLEATIMVDGKKVRIKSGEVINVNTVMFRGLATPNMSVQVASNADWSTPLSVSPEGTWVHAVTLADGEYIFLFKTVARNGNESATISFLLEIDTTIPEPPTITRVRDLIGVPADIEDGGRTNDPQPVFSGTAEPETTIYVKANGQLIGTTTGTSWTYKPPQLMNGNYKFSITAVDAAKNESEPVEFSFIVDTTAPSPPAVKEINDNVLPDTGLIKNGGTTDDTTPTFFGVARKNILLFAALDSGPLSPIAINTETLAWEYTPPALSEGQHIVQFFAEDLSGNVSQPNTIIVTVKLPEPPVQPLQMRPTMAVEEETATRWELLAIVDHTAKLSVTSRFVLDAPLTGPGGTLTRITKKKKLRLLRAEHPDSEPENKKYIWRFPVTRGGLSCGCEFIHIGMYDLRCGPWRVGQEREVRLLIADILYTDINPAAGEVELVAGDAPVLYPQYLADGSYRVVKVMNLMYDIYPPNTFVRSEPVGDEFVDRTFINTEIPRLVFVYEGCGESFFLINAECD